MKTVFTLIGICTFLLTSAQVTTADEYNYMKTSLVKDMAEYRDLKRGYYANYVDSTQGGSINVYFIKFGRDKDSTAAGYVIKTVSSDFWGSGISYWYMPAANSKTKVSYGWDAWNTSIIAMTEGIKNVLLSWFSQGHILK